MIVATRNAHKTREIQRILGADFAVRDLSAYPEIAETVENGKTFEENAVLKATAASSQVSGLVVADDSGLTVDALNGMPGVLSFLAQVYAGGIKQKEIEELISSCLPFLLQHEFDDDSVCCFPTALTQPYIG